MNIQRFWWAAACLLLPAPVLGAGVEYPDNGTVALGRGGAFAANPSDGLAFQYNPAGLAQQRGLNVTIDARLAAQHVRFASTSIPGAKPVENSADPFFAPSVAASWGLGAVGPLSELTFAIGATGPSSIGQLAYPEDGAQRYALIESDYFIGYYSAAVAVGVGEQLRIGVTGQLVQGKAMFSQAVWSGPNDEDPDNKGFKKEGDSLATFSGESDPIPAVVLGLTWLPMPELAVGASYRPAIDFDAPGTLVTRPPPAFDKPASEGGVEQVGDAASLQLTLADIIRLGVQYQPPSKRWLVEAGGTWERWSDFERIVIETHDIRLKHIFSDQPDELPDVIFEKQFRDAFSARLGGEYAVLPQRLTVRGGYVFETSAIDPEFAGVEFPNWSRHVASIGATLHAWGASFDVAYAHHFVETLEVGDSQVVQQVSPELTGASGFGLKPAKASVIGNGTYDASMDIVSVSVRLPLTGLTSRF